MERFEDYAWSSCCTQKYNLVQAYYVGLVGAVCQIGSSCSEYLDLILPKIITYYRLLSIVIDFCSSLIIAAGRQPAAGHILDEQFENFGSMVRWSNQSVNCSAVQSAVCLNKCLAVAPVFLLVATHYFVLFSCKICAEIVVHGMFALFLNGQEVLYGTFFFGFSFLFQVSRLVIASILLSHRLLSREQGL